MRFPLFSNSKYPSRRRSLRPKWWRWYPARRTDPRQWAVPRPTELAKVSRPKGIPGVLRGGNWNGNLQLHQNLPSRSLSFCSVETHWFNCKPFPGCIWCGTPDPTGISGLEIGDRGYLYVATCGLDEISRFSADYALAATKRRHHRGRLSSCSWCGRKRVQFKGRNP